MQGQSARYLAGRQQARHRQPHHGRSPRRFITALVAYLLIASCMAATTAHVLHSRSSGVIPPASTLAAPEVPAAKYLVLIVLDGARPDYFGMTSLPHVDALRAAGTQFTNAFDGILESETPAGHTAIATGSRPDSNGILGFDWATVNDRFSLFDPAKMVNFIQLIKDGGAPTIAGLYKAAHPGARVVALSGHKYYAAAPLGGPSADAIMYYQGDPKGNYVPVAVPGHAPPAAVLNDPGLTATSTTLPNGAEDHLATKLALSAFTHMKPNVLMINYPEFDWPLGHVDGGSLDRAKVITAMQRFDADLGELEAAYRAAGVLNQTEFVITSDHGMMPIHRFVPESILTNAVSAAGTTAPDIAYNSAGYVWLADASKGQTVAQNVLAAHDPGIASAYYLTLIDGHPRYVAAGGGVSPAAEVANQYLLSALINGHEPQVVVFGTEGSTFSDPKSNWKGDHGGNTWEAQHIPLIISGAGIQRDRIVDAPVQMDDIAPTALVAMGVEPTGMEGNPLTEALLYPTTAARSLRATERSMLTPVAGALKAGG